MRFWAVIVLAAGCSAGARQVRVAVTLQGNAVGPAEQQRCVAAAQEAGAVVDGSAPVQAVVTADKEGSRLQVVTMRRGLIRDDKRGPAAVEALCKEAALAAAAAHEPASTDAPGGAAAPAGPMPSAETSGAAYRGPISDH